MSMVDDIRVGYSVARFCVDRPVNRDSIALRQLLKKSKELELKMAQISLSLQHTEDTLFKVSEEIRKLSSEIESKYNLTKHG